MSSHECVMSLGIFGASRLDDDALLRENPKNNILKTPLPRHTSCMCPAGPACSAGHPARTLGTPAAAKQPTMLLLREQLPSLLPSSHDLRGFS